MIMKMTRYKLSEISLNITDGEHGTVKDDINGNYYLLSCKNIKNGIINIKDNERTISKESYNKIQKRIKLEYEDILITTVGTIGEMAIIKVNNINYCFQRSVGIIKPNKELVDPYYLYYAIKNEMHQISTLVKGAVQKCLFINDMKQIELNIPRLDVQYKVSKILSIIDKKVELNNEINNNLHEIAENLFKYVYEKGKKCKLQELISNVSTGSRPKGGAETSGIPSVGAEKIEKFGIYNYSSEKYISEEYFNKLKTGIIKSGDVLLYKDGAYTGKVSMALNGFPHDKCAANEHVFIINTEDNWAKYYLYFTLYNQENRNKIFTMASSKAAQPGLNQSELKTLDIKLADKKEIIKFEKKVESIMFKIAHNTLQNKILERLRDTLLPKLMNGEIDLDNIEI